MKTAIGITALVLYGFAIGVNAQGHGGGHGGGGHSGGGHAGGGHAGGGHAGGGHSGRSSGGHSGSGGHSSGGSASGAQTSGTSTRGGAIATTRANRGAREANGAAARGSNSAQGNQIDDGVPPYSRPRDGRDPIGTAVPRTLVPQTSPSTSTILLPGIRSYPFGFYRPLAVGFGFGVYGFSPYNWGYADPWYGPPVIGSSGDFAEDCEGALRLRIKPNDSRVYVDGQYVGVVDDFDGIFQKLHVTCGPHRIEVQGEGYEPLVFDARIMPGHKTTYQGVLTRIQ